MRSVKPGQRFYQHQQNRCLIFLYNDNKHVLGKTRKQWWVPTKLKPTTRTKPRTLGPIPLLGNTDQILLFCCSVPVSSLGVLLLRGGDKGPENGANGANGA